MIFFIKRPLAIRCRSRQTSAALLIATWIGLAAPSVVQAKADLQESSAPQRTTVSRDSRNVRLDHSGRKRVGMASYYGREFYGRKMADGTPMRPYSDSAASRTLPLGTRAKVVSLKDGKAALVTIRDRGPYARGRIIDLSPGTARQLGIIKAGVASVAVTPITVPQLDGTTKWVVALCQPERAELIALAAGAPYSRLVKAC
jgi:rare lipoprotein A